MSQTAAPVAVVPAANADVATLPISRTASWRARTFPPAVAWSLLASLAAFCALQLWRPFYFLGDDNLSGAFPVWVAFGRQLWSGNTPFFLPHLFGGFDVLRDPGGVSAFNPWLFLVSPLALTPARIALIDALAAIYLFISAFAFSHLLLMLRATNRADATLSDRRIAFLAVSYTFSLWMILTGPNWISFLGNQSALPVLFLGLFHPRRRDGVVLVACGVLQSLVAGHLNSFLLTLVFVSAWIVMQWLQTRDSEAARRWIGGGLVAIFLTAIPLYLAARGFSAAPRSGALAVESSSLLAVPAPVLLVSWFFGPFAALAGKFGLFFNTQGISGAVACCLASWCVWHSRSWGGTIGRSCLAAAALVALFVVRPPWLAAFLSHVPLLRSTRIPFREIFVLVFFLHLWIAVRPVSARRVWPRFSYALGAIFFGFSLVPFQAPVFTPFPLDRRVLFSGEYETTWRRVRELMPEGGAFVPVLAVDVPTERVPQVPWLLLGAYNYPALVEVKSKSGYVIKGFEGRILHGVAARGVMGTFEERDIAALHHADPNLKFMVLTNVRPLRIEWRDGRRQIPLPVPTLPPLSRDSFHLVD